MESHPRAAPVAAGEFGRKAAQGFEALMEGDEKVLGGSLKTRAQATASKLMPDSAKAQMQRAMAEPGFR